MGEVDSRETWIRYVRSMRENRGYRVMRESKHKGREEVSFIYTSLFRFD